VSAEKRRTEELNISGEKLVSTVKELVRQGNIRRITVKNRDGRSLIEVPLSLGVVGILLLPTLAALGAIAALVTECTIVLERCDE
jgi:DNA-binding Lrp family transcriptional regulator